MEKKPITNNVDIAMQKVRQLQQMIFNPRISPQDLFNYTNSIIESMEEATVEIRVNYEEISRKLTEEWSGKAQSSKKD